MALKKHNFNIRFYTLRSTENYNFRELVNHFKNNTMPVIMIGNYFRHIHIYSDNSDFDKSISGYFSTYREDILHKGNKKTGIEELLPLEDDESIIERNYFTLFYGSELEILLYHNASLYGNIRNFEGYITNLTKHLSGDRSFKKIDVIEIGADNISFDKKIPVKQIEYKISRPLSKKTRPGEDPWVQERFDEMTELGIRTQRAILHARNGLNPTVWDKIIRPLIELDKTSMLKVTIRDIEQPIDLLHNVLKDKFYINAPSKEEVEPEKIFSKIREIKEKHDDILKNYLDDES